MVQNVSSQEALTEFVGLHPLFWNYSRIVRQYGAPVVLSAPPPRECPGCCISGPAGPRGVSGLPGRPGQPGYAGILGPPGITPNKTCPRNAVYNPPPCKPCPRGPPGIKGWPGFQGDNGPFGPHGDKGLDGTPGNPGDPGPSGPDGFKGVPGMPGDKGPTLDGHVQPGPPGDNGDAGPVGRVGPAGLPGRDGPVGKNGEPGWPGDPGESGQQGYPGTEGTISIEGPPGNPSECICKHVDNVIVAEAYQPVPAYPSYSQPSRGASPFLHDDPEEWYPTAPQDYVHIGLVRAKRPCPPSTKPN